MGNGPFWIEGAGRPRCQHEHKDRPRGGWPVARSPQVTGLVRVQACRKGPGLGAGKVAGSGGVAGTEARFPSQSNISGGGSQEGFGTGMEGGMQWIVDSKQWGGGSVRCGQRQSSEVF